MRSALCAATTSWGESGFMNRWYSGTSLGADASGTETTADAAIARTERRIKGRIDTSVNRLRGSITRDAVLYAGRRHRLSRPSEKFRFEPSRKFLLTALRLKDGTNRDEPRGTRLFE